MRKTKIVLQIIILLNFIHLNSMKYNIRNYTIEDGLIDREVLTIFEDSKGNIWIGTFTGGVDKFDGEKFVNYSKKDGLSDIGVPSIAEDTDGNIWFGTFGGLCKYDGNTFSTYKYKKGKDNEYFITAIEIDNEDNLWLATFEGLVKFNPKSEEFANFSEQSYSEEIFSAIDALRNENRTISSILKVGDNQNIKKTFTIKGKKEILVVAYGESTSKKCDYGWIEDKSIIWDLSEKATLHAGGAFKNRVKIAILSLNTGIYSLNYRSDDSHSYNSWNAQPPLHPESWGIALYEVSHNFVKKYQKIISDTYKYANFIPFKEVSSVFIDNSGMLWIGTYNGLKKFNPTLGLFNHNSHNPKDSTSLSHNSITSICGAGDNNLWIGTRNGLNRFDPEKNTFERFFADNEKSNSLSDNQIKSLCTDNQGTLYIAPQKGGIDIYRNNSFNHLSKEDGFVNNIIYKIIEDREGNIWFGGRGGISRYARELFSKVSTNQEFIDTIIEDEEGNLWFDGLRKDITKYDGKEFNNFDISAKRIFSSMKDKNGNLWFGTTNEVIRYDGENFVNFSETNGLNSGLTRKMIEDRYGNIWIGGSDGLNLMTKSITDKITYNDYANTRLFSTIQNLDNVYITDMIESDSGDLWLSTRNGIFQLTYDNKILQTLDFDANQNYITINKYNETDGLIENYVICIIEDHNNNLWLGTKGAGIMKFDGEKVIAHYTMEDGLADNVIFSFAKDKDNNLWIGTKGGGVSKFDGTYFSNYNPRNSLISSVYVNSIHIDKNQNIWFATGEGLTKYDYQKDKSRQVPPTIYFEHIREMKSKIQIDIHNAEKIKLKHNHNFIEFKYMGISMQSPESIIYQYKLTGFDKNWKDTKESKVTYSFLTPGHYTFQVKARNLFGLWSENPAEFSFTILPPWYQTWWFRTFLVLFVSALLYFLYKLRVRVLEKNQLHLEQVVETRTHELNIEKTKVEEKNTKLTDSINYASLIQNSILPREAEIAKSIQDFFLFWKPKDIVGGDFYWFYPIPESKNYIISVIDCTGHGVPGAFMSMTANSILNNIVREKKIYEPDEILNLLHKEIRYTLRQQSKESQQDGLDISLCLVNPEKKEILFSGAMQSIFIVKNGKIKRIRGDRFSIGGRQKEAERIFKKKIIKYNSGDKLYLMSDGLADQKVMINGKSSRWKTKNVILLLEKYAGLPMKEQKNKIEEELKKLQGNFEQRDDITVLGVKL